MEDYCTRDEVHILRQQLHRQSLYLRFSMMGWLVLTVMLCLGGASSVLSSKTVNAEEINVGRINIVEPDGGTRLVIANSEKFPLPKLDGRVYSRKYQPAGIVFYDSKGSEMGGLALTDTATDRVGALAFDYPNWDAIGLRCAISGDGNDSTTGLVINSRPASGLNVVEASKVAHTRIGIQNHNENAEILLSDPDGNNRLRLVVDDKGEPSIEMLDASGTVTWRIPELPMDKPSPR